MFNHGHKKEIYKVITPFVPALLIDKSLSHGIDHWLEKETEELFIVYFNKKQE